MHGGADLKLLYPDHSFHRIEEIPTSFFTHRGIRALLLDVDNTLTGDNSQEVSDDVVTWLEQQRTAGLRLFVLSNNKEARVAPFAEKLGLGYISDAKKPGTRHVRERLLTFGVTPAETAVIGDQLFTDILCGNRSGCTTILVEPYALENYGLYRIKRLLEKPILKRYRRMKGSEERL